MLFSMQGCVHINGPKFSEQGLAFSSEGATMALLEVRLLHATMSLQHSMQVPITAQCRWPPYTPNHLFT